MRSTDRWINVILVVAVVTYAIVMVTVAHLAMEEYQTTYIVNER